MNGRRWGAALALWLVLANAAGAGERHALLVGVAKLEQLAQAEVLSGVDNDIDLAVEMARDWGVAPARRQVLARRAGADAPPTSDALKSAFDRLLREVHAGDEVLLYLAGHGTQQPIGLAGDIGELDGLDEVFLLADSTPWSAQRGSVGRALVDNDLRERLAVLTRLGVFVWLIVDACHAGTMARGGIDDGWATDEWTAVTVRRLAPEVLGIDRQRWSQALAQSLTSVRRTLRRLPGLSSSGLADGVEMPPIAAFYAVHEAGDALEVALRPNGRRVGLFTWKLKSTFDALRQGKGEAPTFEDLARAVLAAYGEMPAFVPRPLFEGSDWRRRLWPVAH